MESGQVKVKSSLRPCPQGCGFSIHDKDLPEGECLWGYARRALTEPGSCECCHMVLSATQERRVKFVERVLGKTAITYLGPPSTECRYLASYESSGQELVVEDPVGNWADHMSQPPPTMPARRHLS
ncbi:uncharacterized protein V6R79_000418 [Siganus canaliculatus]